MREVIFIKSLCQDIVLFLYKTVNFKTTTESLGKNSRKIPLCTDYRRQGRLQIFLLVMSKIINSKRSGPKVNCQPLIFSIFSDMSEIHLKKCCKLKVVNWLEVGCSLLPWIIAFFSDFSLLCTRVKLIRVLEKYQIQDWWKYSIGLNPITYRFSKNI